MTEQVTQGTPDPKETQSTDPTLPQDGSRLPRKYDSPLINKYLGDQDALKADYKAGNIEDEDFFEISALNKQLAAESAVKDTDAADGQSSSTDTASESPTDNASTATDTETRTNASAEPTFQISLRPEERDAMTHPDEDTEKNQGWTPAKKRGVAVAAIISVLTPVAFGAARLFGNNDNTVVAQPGTSTSGPATPGSSTAPSAETSPSASPSETIEMPASDMGEAAKYINRDQEAFLTTGSNDQQLGVDGEWLLHQLGGPESSIYYQDTTNDDDRVFDINTGETIGAKSPILRALKRSEQGKTGPQALQDIRNELGAQGMADELTYAYATIFGARIEGGDIDTLNVDKGANLTAGLFANPDSPEAKKLRSLVNNQKTTEVYTKKNRWTDAEASDEVMPYTYKGKTYDVIVMNFTKDGDPMHAIVTSRDTEFTGPNPYDSSTLASLDISKLQILEMGKGSVDVNEKPVPPQE